MKTKIWIITTIVLLAVVAWQASGITVVCSKNEEPSVFNFMCLVVV